MIKTIEVRTTRRSELHDITEEVRRAVGETGIRDGVCTVFVPHTTAGITINENADPSVQRDILTQLERMVPRSGSYTHGEGNSDAHIKACLIGCDVTLFVEAGRLVLGTWQGIYLAEFDGPRARQVKIKVYPD